MRDDAVELLARTVAFLNRIGIPAHFEHGANGFSPGVRIDQGKLAVDPACRISTLLHDAGHLRSRRCASGRGWTETSLRDNAQCSGQWTR